MRFKIKVPNDRGQRGFSLLELLIAMVLLGILSLGVVQSLVVSSKVKSANTHNAVAKQLAVDRMEELFTANPEILSDAIDSTENLTFDGADYQRVIDVTINADRTRTVDIVVTSLDEERPARAELSNSFALWGKR